MTASPGRSRVTVIVPVLDAERTLSACLNALNELEPAPEEILLVDNGSIDTSLSLMREFASGRTRSRVQVLEETRRGAAAARNRGLFSASAEAEIIAFTDSDCTPARDWLAELLAPFSDPTVSAVAGRIAAEASGSTLERFSALYTLRLFDAPSRHELWTPRRGGFPTANFAVRRETAVDLGGFDTNVVLYGEDFDFCARLYARGGTIAYTPLAVVTHHHRDRLSGLVRQAFGFGRGHAYMMRRHGRRLLWIDLPFRPIGRRPFPLGAWIDLSSADKKLLLLALSGAADPRLWVTLLLYGGYLIWSSHRRALKANAPASLAVSAEMAALLVLKSAAMTAGRIWGSLRYRSLCL